jgi:hypothetical protein
MKLIVILLFTIIFSSSFAQTDNIIRNAVFLNFEEFRNNTPSIHPINIFLEQTGEDKYTLKYQVDSAGSTEKYKKRIWGFSDSNNIYIKYNSHYAKFMAVGRICVFKYFQESRTQWTGGIPANSSHMGIPASSYKTQEHERSYILDVNTGNKFTLKASAVKKLIADDPELLAEFNQLSEYHQERDKLTYIRKYNERNAR